MIRLLSVGSRGDLQPYLAILLELQRRGHSVDDAGQARAAGLKQLLEAMLTTADAVMTGTDLLLLTPLALWGYHLAEAEGCPLIRVDSKFRKESMMHDTLEPVWRAASR